MKDFDHFFQLFLVLSSASPLKSTDIRKEGMTGLGRAVERGSDAMIKGFAVLYGEAKCGG